MDGVAGRGEEHCMGRKGHTGFSLIEVILAFSILAVASTALGLVEISNSRRSQELKERDIAFGRGQAILERLLRMPFGQPDAATASAHDLDLVFGSDEDVRQVSLTQLQQRDTDGDGVVDQEPIRFRLEGVEDKGLWEVHVDADLDGNGRIEPTLEGVDTREGRTDLLRVEIRRDERIVLRTLRARTPQEQDESDLSVD
jgi:prepilin-type N-terminal cleavage/methylation domain-containing protein